MIGSASEYMGLLKSATSKFNGVASVEIDVGGVFYDTCFSLKNERFEKTEHQGLLLWKVRTSK